VAGATCAREIARLGVEVVAFERDSFPREKVCGGFLAPGAVDILDRLNVLDALRRSGAVPVQSARVRAGSADVAFELAKPGLGISRRVLDSVLADHPSLERATVRSVDRRGTRFHVQLDDAVVEARFVVDAGGKLSRFSKRKPTDFFGVQFYESTPRGSVLDFWFLEDGYGGAVTVEGDRSNACFLVRKDSLKKYTARGDCLVTGPIGYNLESSEWINIGDSGGMVDPFCGAGIYHALDTASLAAKAIAEGIRSNQTYEQVSASYRASRSSRWRWTRFLGGLMRPALGYPSVVGAGLRANPAWFLQRLWA